MWKAFGGGYGEPRKDCNTPQPRPQPVLIRLVVTGATPCPGGHEALVQNGQNVTVTAVTQPNDGGTHTGLVWTSGQVGAAADIRLVSRDNAGSFTVTASLNGGPPQSATIFIRDLTALVSVTGQALVAPANTWKIYAMEHGEAFVQASVLPNDDPCRSRLQWTNSAPSRVGLDTRVVDASAAANITVTATLLTKSLSVNLRICDWPLLAVQTITFLNCHTVNRDTIGPFDNQWQAGRAQDDQSPICYTQNSVIRLSAVLRVARDPTENENVNIRATAAVGTSNLTWVANNVAVAHGAATVNFPAANSNNPIPAQVDRYDAITIRWEMTQSNGTWQEIGSTQHTLYATLGAPNGTPPYWTLLHYSCRAARGLNNPDAVAAALITPFATRQIVRKRDGTNLTYWNPETNCASDTAALLASPVGNGHCGSWAEMLIDSYKVHGITTATKVWLGPRAYHAKKVLDVYGITAAGRAANAGGVTGAVTTAANNAGTRAEAAIRAATHGAALPEATQAHVEALQARFAVPALPMGTPAPDFTNLRRHLGDARNEALGAPTQPTQAAKETASYDAFLAALTASVVDRPAIDADPNATNDHKAAAAAYVAAAWAWAAVTKNAAFPNNRGFLVRNWTFEHPPASNANALTHEMGSANPVIAFFSTTGKCRPTNPLPGQQNATPPPKFLNHFIVRYDPTGEFFDPSYGVGAYPNSGAWETAAVNGLWNGDNAGYDTALRGNPPGLVEFYRADSFLLL